MASSFRLSCFISACVVTYFNIRLMNLLSNYAAIQTPATAAERRAATGERSVIEDWRNKTNHPAHVGRRRGGPLAAVDEDAAESGRLPSNMWLRRLQDIPTTAVEEKTTEIVSSPDARAAGREDASATPTAQPPAAFVACRLGIGRLGNDMFVYASTLGVALRHNATLVLVLDDSTAPYVDRLKRTFAITAAVVSNPAFSLVIGESGWGRYNAHVEDGTLLGAQVLLSGYLQSWKYFKDFRSRVKTEFTFAAAIEKMAADYVRGVTSDSRIPVGVHVRRGDMVDSSLYRAAPDGYLLRAMSYIAALGLAPTFVVTSDDVGWSRKVLRGISTDRWPVHYPEKSAEEDLAILSKCNHTIITSGSFGWWAAWLSGGEVVYYKDFMPESSLLYEGHAPEDYYPRHWVGIE